MSELPDVETFIHCVDATSLHRLRKSVDLDALRLLQGVSQRQLGRIFPMEDPQDYVDQESLGTDALAPDIDLPRFSEMFRMKRGSVKSSLMDQYFLAGTGNVYSDEILFQAGPHPQSRAREFAERGVGTLHRSHRYVLSVAVECEADPGRLPQSRMRPHRQRGGRRPQYGVQFGTVAAGGRAAYYFPTCQGRMP